MKSENAEVLARIQETTARSQECCERKKRYTDEWTARGIGAHMMEAEPGRDQLYVYKCKWCRGHHLTRQPQGRPDAAVDYYFKEASK